MRKVIYADTLLQYQYHNLPYTHIVPIDVESDSSYKRGWNDAIRAVFAEAIAADVAPVVHGHWRGEYDGYADGCPVYDMWFCSECDYCVEDDEYPEYNYCPSCGAKMGQKWEG